MRDNERIDDGELALAVLESLAIAVLRRVGPREYVFFGRMPSFYRNMFGGTPEAPNVTPWERSDMLRFFLDDAEDFFEEGSGGSLTSGTWQEDGVEEGKALIVTALSVRGRQLLVLRYLSDDFADRSRILQKAREHLLERRMISGALEVYKHKSRFDELTTLHNRADFMEALRTATAHSAKTGAPLALLLLDIDDFKRVNDTHGHLAGDSVLSALGRLLRASLRRDDLPARYGGEEFAVLSPFSGGAQALRLAEKLRRDIAGHTFGSLPPITVSIGCTDYIGGETPESFIERADNALYDAKRTGKDRVCSR